MKFKMQDNQNQLIERISDKHLVVGVDIAQQLHVARAVNFRGIVVGDPLLFENNEEGFATLLKWIHTLQSKNNLDSAIVGMEPTGHYWINLSKWLFNHNIEVVTVNPYSVKRNKENRDNTQSKSDKKDALVIADMVKNGYYSFVRNTPESFEKLRVLMSNRDVVVKRLVSSKVNVIKNNRHKYSVSAMCDVLQLSRSTYYYEAKEETGSDDELTAAIIDIFHKSRQNYGTRKIKHELKKLGIIRPLKLLQVI